MANLATVPRVGVAGSGPRLVGVASLIAAGWCAWWLSGAAWPAGGIPLRPLFLIIPCSFLISATLLLLDDR